MLSYSVDGLECESPFWVPPFTELDGPVPALFVAPNLWGPNAYWDQMIGKYAQLGYAVMIVDMYGKETRPQTHPDAFEVIKPLKADRVTVRRRAKAALECLAAQPEVDASKIAGVGYCFGGMVVLEMARAGFSVVGVTSLHGSLGTPMPATEPGEIAPSILALHGAEDPGIQDPEVAEFMAEMRAAKADWQLVHFGGQVHAFTDRVASRPGTAEYHALTDQRSWTMLKNFLAEKFGA